MKQSLHLIMILQLLLSHPVLAMTRESHSHRPATYQAENRESKGWLSPSLTFHGQIYSFLRTTLSRRYNVKVKGLEEVYAKGNKKILFLFEHPALMDPVIFFSQTGDRFHPRPLITSAVNVGLLKVLFRTLNALIVPDTGESMAKTIKALNQEVLESLRRGENIAMSPSGQLKRKSLEEIRGKSMAASAIQNLPEGARVVIVTNKGMWGSSFGHGYNGKGPAPAQNLSGEMLKGLMTNSLKKRDVELTFEEIASDKLEELKKSDRMTINNYLEAKINAVPQENLFVPLNECLPSCVLPEPISKAMMNREEMVAIQYAAKDIPSEFRDKIVSALIEIRPDKKDTIQMFFDPSRIQNEKTENALTLAEFGWDSVDYTMVQREMKEKMGFSFEKVLNGSSASEFLLQAYISSKIGENGNVDSKVPARRPVDLRWFRYYHSKSSVVIPEGRNLVEVLFKKARENPEAAWMSDALSGVLTYREGITKILILSRVISKMKGQNIGIMLPPGVGASLMYFATLHAGKTPTMINYTAGNDNLKYSMDEVGVESIMTSKEFVSRLNGKNLKVDAIADRFIFSEDLIKKMQERSLKNASNIAMALIQQTRGGSPSLWPNGRSSRKDDPAVILFTSGSSHRPKPVVLSHKNILQNVRDVSSIFHLYQSDAVSGFAPFFHSLGLTGTLVMPAILGVRANYSPDVTNYTEISQSVYSHLSSVIIGPPQLLRQIFQSASPEQLDSLRYVIVGAEELTPAVATFLKEKARNAVILEGAGATETSPIWAINPPNDVRLGYVGKVLPSITAEIVDNDSLSLAIEKNDPSLIQTIGPDESGARRGELVLSGDSVITSYFKHLHPESFFVWNGRTFYRTGDAVSINADGYVKIEGRFSRNHKIRGEMINQQMLERQISDLPQLQPGADGKLTYFIGGGLSPESGETVTVLLTTSKDVTLDDVNQRILNKYSATWAVKKILRVDEIPLLGTGKVDAGACKKMILELLQH